MMKRYFFFAYLFPLTYFVFFCVPNNILISNVLNTIFSIAYTVCILVLVNYDVKTRKNHVAFSISIVFYFLIVYILNFYNSHYLMGIKGLQRPIVIIGAIAYPFLGYIPGLIYLSCLKRLYKDDFRSGFTVPKISYFSFTILWLLYPFVAFFDILLVLISTSFYTITLFYLIVVILLLFLFLLFINSFEKLSSKRKLLNLILLIFYLPSIFYCLFMLFFFRNNHFQLEYIHYLFQILFSSLVFIPLFVVMSLLYRILFKEEI